MQPCPLSRSINLSQFRGHPMKTLVIAPFKFVGELIATIVVCGFLFALMGGAGAYLSGNHCYRPR